MQEEIWKSTQNSKYNYDSIKPFLNALMILKLENSDSNCCYTYTSLQSFLHV